MSDFVTAGDFDLTPWKDPNAGNTIVSAYNQLSAKYPGYTSYKLESSVSTSGSSFKSGGSSASATVSYAGAIVSQLPVSQGEPPVAFVPPPRAFALGPKGAGTNILYFDSIAEALEADAGCVFYKEALRPAVGCTAYWELVVGGTGSDTVCGAGVGSATTDVTAKPGEGGNPGCMLYVEGGQWYTASNDTTANVAGSGVPAKLGVGVEVLTETSLRVTWWADGVQVGGPVDWAFAGPLWVPVFWLPTPGYTFTLEDSA